MLDFQIIGPDDAAWTEFLSRNRHDFYHLPGYCRVCAETESATAQAILAVEGDNYFFAPYLLRPLSQLAWLGAHADGWCDASSPYGYPGPLRTVGDPAFIQRVVNRWISELRERRVVSAFLRFHPLMPPPSGAFVQLGEVLLRGRTVSIDLTLDEETLRRQVRENHRRDIKKAQRLGLTTRIETGDVGLGPFSTIYYETMDRAHAPRYYYFQAEYFQGLKRQLGDRAALCSVLDPEGQFLAGGLFVECDGIVQYHLGATRDDALRLRPAKLMFHDMIDWARRRGNRVMHLGGGIGAREDSLFDFKAGFSPLRHPFYTWQSRINVERYDELARMRFELGDGLAESDFFPIYRA